MPACSYADITLAAPSTHILVVMPSPSSCHFRRHVVVLIHADAAADETLLRRLFLVAAVDGGAVDSTYAEQCLHRHGGNRYLSALLARLPTSFVVIGRPTIDMMDVPSS